MLQPRRIVAEKSPALVERSGRARDVYDAVNIARNFAADVSVGRVREIAARKFAFKGLPAPRVDTIMARVDPAVLKTDWENALNHQLQALPSASEFLRALERALDWLLARSLPESRWGVGCRRRRGRASDRTSRASSPLGLRRGTTCGWKSSTRGSAGW